MALKNEHYGWEVNLDMAKWQSKTFKQYEYLLS